MGAALAEAATTRAEAFFETFWGFFVGFFAVFDGLFLPLTEEFWAEAVVGNAIPAARAVTNKVIKKPLVHRLETCKESAVINRMDGILKQNFCNLF